MEQIDLSMLAPEIQERIINALPSQKHNSMLITKDIKQASAAHHLTHACSLPITRKEILKYDTHYKPFAICVFAKFNRYGSYSGIVMSDICNNLAYLSEYIFGVHISDDDALEVAQATSDLDITGIDNDGLHNIPDDLDVIGYDLVTTYHVLTNRESCTEIYDGFAKKTVVDTLAYRHGNYQDNISNIHQHIPEDIEESFNYVLRKAVEVLEYYVYLKCNAMIMGISIRTLVDRRESMDLDGHPTHLENIEEMISFVSEHEKLIDRYYPLVLRYLTNLDDTVDRYTQEKFIMLS